MDGLFQVTDLGDGLWEIADVIGCRCYFVKGANRAALIDSCVGIGDIRPIVSELAGSLPVTVLLTHRHHDHIAGSYLFDDVRIPREEDVEVQQNEEDNAHAIDILVEQGRVPAGEFSAMKEGHRPDLSYFEEGDVLDLGGITIEGYFLPGHTDHSIGYLLRERRLLISGDAVTPCMCLFFPESLPIATWRQTLEKMKDMPFDTFRIGHYSHEYTKADLDGFLSSADYALSGARGLSWAYTYIEGLRGSLYIWPDSPSMDADSADFRAVIGPYVPRERKHRRHRKPSAENGN
ncbi:MAG: MBL fold metallo-hydrolase [Tractidigestivibacter sp.]|jgi:glyoxylase-like metal-dependent hydrolase (beta-lactamase superfamily II)|uniref:MBL fold metallo-hydrolase n=1 Tax=Tractidigestivibacter sp. TaxID=2847320 RepID=UPI003D933E5F